MYGVSRRYRGRQINNGYITEAMRHRHAIHTVSGARPRAASSCHLGSGVDKCDTTSGRLHLVEPSASSAGSTESLNQRVTFNPSTAPSTTRDYR